MKERINTLLNQVKKIASTKEMNETVYMAKLVLLTENNKSLLIKQAEKVIREADTAEKEFGLDHLTFENLLDVEDVLLDCEALGKVEIPKSCKSITLKMVYTFDGKFAEEKSFKAHSKLELVEKIRDWRYSMSATYKDLCWGYFTFDNKDTVYDFDNGQIEHECFDNGRMTNAEYLNYARRFSENSNYNFIIKK